MSKSKHFSQTNTIEELFYTLAGASSVCWDENRIFDSSKATEFCRDALVRLNELIPFGDDLYEDLRKVLNHHSVETGSDTPDIILATYLIDTLKVWNKTIRRRNVWQNDHKFMIQIEGNK